MVKISFFLFLAVVSNFSFAQNNQPFSDITKIPTPIELMLKGFPYFFKDVTIYVEDKVLTSMGMDDYNFFVKMHEKDPAGSPFRVFLGNQFKRIPTQANYFPFVNNKSDFEDLITESFGLCSGITYLLRKFNTLAYFDPENKFKEIIPERAYKDAWYQFYRKKIDSVMNLQPTIIPGFKDLNDFSHSKLNSYLRKTVIQQWLINNTSISGLIQLTGVKKTISIEQTTKLHAQLIKRLSFNYNPIIYLAKPKTNAVNPLVSPPNDNVIDRDKWIHVLQVMRVSNLRPDGSYEIAVLDINNSDAISAEVIVSVRVEDGVAKAIWTADYTELSAIALVPSDDREIAQMVKNQLDWCTTDQAHVDLCLKGMP